jgi:cytochrome c peroxidase
VARCPTEIGGFVLFAAACGGHGTVQSPRPLVLDDVLQARLIAASAGEGLALFTQPESEDFESIPQDPKKPITREKVDLGRLLFHETALGTKPVLGIGEGTYSCATCHHALAGFQAGVAQGIGGGGSGFGRAGQGRAVSAAYLAERIDVQPIRSPSA